MPRSGRKTTTSRAIRMWPGTSLGDVVEVGISREADKLADHGLRVVCGRGSPARRTGLETFRPFRRFADN
jgi:hypothetical protein